MASKLSELIPIIQEYVEKGESSGFKQREKSILKNFLMRIDEIEYRVAT